MATKNAKKPVNKKVADKKEKINKAVKKEEPKEEIIEQSNDTMTEKKPKSLGSLVLGVILVIVLIGVFVISQIMAPKYLAEINFKNYEKIINNESYIVYYGNDTEQLNSLSTYAKSKKLNIYYINIDKLSDEEKKSIYGNEEIKPQIAVKNNDKKEIITNDLSTSKISEVLVEVEMINKGIEEITVDEYLKVIQEPGYHFMFIGSSTCSWCTKFKPELEKVLETYNVAIYYIDLSTLEEADYYKLIGSNSYFSENNWGTPTSFIYKDGESLTTISGYKDSDSIISLLKQYKVID